MTNESVESYFGKISITKIDNIWPDGLGRAEAFEMNESNCRFVHYPDCQQLTIWLPAYGGLYDSISLILQTNNTIIWKKSINDIINGSVQIILDTLPITPAAYTISIIKSDGLIHRMLFTKYAEGNFPEQEKIDEPPVDLDAPPIVYRDGFGNLLPNEDLILRDAIIEKTINMITRRLEYVNHGRSGEVIYIEGSRRITFYMEMGGGSCIFYIDIPSESLWEKNTGFPLDRRADIIKFVAEQTAKDQASTGIYKMEETSIVYYHVK